MKIKLGFDVQYCNLCNGVLSDTGCSNHDCINARNRLEIMRGLHALAISETAGQKMGSLRRSRAVFSFGRRNN